MYRRRIGAVTVVVVALLALAATTMRTGLFGGDAAASPGSPTLAADPVDGSPIKADRGLFRSSDRGASWTELPVPDALHPDTLHLVATNPNAPSSIYAAGKGVIRSDDGGQTWRDIGNGLPDAAIGALTVNSTLPDTLYVWIARNGVFRTEDGGGAWSKMDDGPPQGGPPVTVLALAHSTLEGSMKTGWLYAATPDGIYLSMDCF